MPVENPLMEVPDENRNLMMGFTPDAGQEQTRFWYDGRNVQFRNGGIESVSGYSSILTPTGNSPVRGATQQRRSNLTQRLYWGDQSNLYYWNTATVTTAGSGYNGITDATVNQRATTWSFVVWGDFIGATNGVDEAQLDEGSGFSQWLQTGGGALPFTKAEILIKRGPHVLALNTSNGYNWVEWCSQDDVKDWNPTAENSAGNLVLRDVDSAIIAAVPLGDRIAVYTADRQILLAYLGSPNYFGFSPSVKDIGAVSKQSVVSVHRMNYGLGRLGLWRTDGVQMDYIDEGKVREYLQDNINWGQASKVSAIHDEEFTRIIWSYPKGASAEPNESVVYDYKRREFSFLDYAWTTAIELEIFNYPVGFQDDGTVYGLNVGDNADADPMTKWAVTKPFSFGKGAILTLLDAVRAGFAHRTGDVEFRVGVRDTLEDSPVWTQWFLLPTGKAPEYVDTSGRYLELEFRSTALHAKWGMDTLSLYGMPIGGAL